MYAPVRTRNGKELSACVLRLRSWHTNAVQPRTAAMNCPPTFVAHERNTTFRVPRTTAMN